MQECDHVWLLPVAAAILGAGGMLIPYIIGASTGHIPALVPYISDGGANAPEGSFFSFLLTFAAITLALTFTLRHQQFVEFYHYRRLDKWWRYVSLVTLIIGYITCIGMVVAGNFNEMTELTVHNYSAIILFVSAMLYIWLNVFLSFLRPRLCSLHIAIFRILLAALALAAFIMHEITLNGNIFVPTGVPPHDEGDNSGYKIEFLTPDSPYYVNHTVATSTEWLLALCIFVSILTLADEFRRSYITLPRMRFHSGADALGSAEGFYAKDTYRVE